MRHSLSLPHSNKVGILSRLIKLDCQVLIPRQRLALDLLGIINANLMALVSQCVCWEEAEEYELQSRSRNCVKKETKVPELNMKHILRASQGELTWRRR